MKSAIANKGVSITANVDWPESIRNQRTMIAVIQACTAAWAAKGFTQPVACILPNM